MTVLQSVSRHSVHFEFTENLEGTTSRGIVGTCNGISIEQENLFDEVSKYKIKHDAP